MPSIACDLKILLTAGATSFRLSQLLVIIVYAAIYRGQCKSSGTVYIQGSVVLVVIPK